MDTIEGNKLIAELDGKNVVPDDSWDIDNPRLNSWSAESLRYHSSWDWLMPAWKKLYNQIGDMYPMPKFAIYDGEKSALKHWYEYMEQPLTKVLIDIAWNNLIDVIQWYNINSKGVKDGK